MTEPIYTYVKGKGWVPYGNTVLSIVCLVDDKLMRVTCTERQPVKGDRVWFWYSQEHMRDHEDTETGFLYDLIGSDGEYDEDGWLLSRKDRFGWVFEGDGFDQYPSRKFVITVEEL